METSFFIGREKIRPRPRRIGFLRWRDRLFMFLNNLAVDATDIYFGTVDRIVRRCSKMACAGGPTDLAEHYFTFAIAADESSVYWAGPEAGQLLVMRK